MSARWKLLAEYLRSKEDEVRLSWSEFDQIVGGVPASASDHYPQWWHGDRSNTRAWRAAGFEATDIQPGVSVRFVRTGAVSPTAHRPRRPTPVAARPRVSTVSLATVDPAQCLLVIPCSATKQTGGRPDTPTDGPDELSTARRRVLAEPDSNTDESVVMPAWQRYQGHFYRAAGPALGRVAGEGRLIILSGGYGLLDGRDLIGNYNRRMNLGDWPRGLLGRLLADHVAASDVDLVAFAATSTPYAKIIRRAPWRLPAERSARLVTIQGVRGTSVVSDLLGQAFRAFMDGAEDYPQGTSVEQLGS